MPFAKQNAEPVYLAQTKALLKRHPRATIIWAHVGLGRIVHPVQSSAEAAERSPTQIEIVEAILADPALRHVHFDISWDEVAKYAVATPASIARVAAILNKYPDRFLFGTDTVAPKDPEPYYAVFDLWAPVWRLLTPEASAKVRTGNYERLFDEGRRRGTRLGAGARIIGALIITRRDGHAPHTDTSDPRSRLADGDRAVRWRAVQRPRAATARRRSDQDGRGRAAAEPKPSMEIYGFAMLDMGHDFKRIDPNWFDTMRVTKLPSFDKQFGEDFNSFAGVRQSRLGVRASTPTGLGELKTTFEFELFGTGVDEGQTTFRLRHAYGEINGFGAGQTWSVFMDPDNFPNSLEYLGTDRHGHVPQRPGALGHDVRRDTSVMLALERPGASGDQGIYADRIELDGIKAAIPAPRLLRRLQERGRLGLPARRRHPAPDQVGRLCSSISSISPATPPAGASISARTSTRARTTSSTSR